MISRLVMLLCCGASVCMADVLDTLHPSWVEMRSSAIGQNSEAWGIAADSAGNVFWVRSEDRPGLLEEFDVMVEKISPDDHLWWSAPTIYGGQYVQQAYVATEHAGIVYVAGRTCNSNDINLKGCDMLVLAIDAATGDTVWARSWGRGFGYEEADGLAVFDDTLYMGGWTVGDTTDVDVAMLAFDRAGHLLRAGAWGTDSTDHQDGHFAVDDSMIYAAGEYAGAPSGVIALAGYDGQCLLAKFDRHTGAIVDLVSFGRRDPWLNLENAFGLTMHDSLLYVTGVTTVAAGNNDVFVACFDKNLHQRWYKTWGGASTEAARSIVVAPDGSIYVGANTQSYGAGNLDIALLKYAPSGDLVWAKLWGGAQEDHVFDIAYANDALYMTGRTASFNTSGKTDALLMKIALDSTNAVARSPIPDHAAIRIAPQPATDDAEISLNLAWPAVVEIYDMRGVRVAAMRVARGPQSLAWDVRAAPAGIYCCRVQAGAAIVSRTIAVVH